MITNIWRFLIDTSYIWKVAFAAGLSWDVAEWAGMQHPYFAPLAAILCLQVTVAASLTRGLERVIGIVCGVVLADITAHFLGLHGWSIALLVLVGIAGARILSFGKTAIPQVAISAMMVLVAGPQHLWYSLDRVFNTLIGAALAILVNLLVLPPDYSDEAAEAVVKAAEKLSEQFSQVASWLRNGAQSDAGHVLQEDTRAYLETLHDAVKQGERAIEATSFSLVAARRRQRLGFLHTALLRLRQGYAHATGVVRTCLDWQEHGAGMPTQAQMAWASRLENAAQCILPWAHEVTRIAHEDGRAGLGRSDAPASASLRSELDTDAGAYEGALWNDLRELTEEMTAPRS